MGSEKRLYILDTNVLMHDPTALFRFEEHDIFLPMMVLEELDAAKKRGQKLGDPAWRLLEKRREEKYTAELTSDFDDYNIDDDSTAVRKMNIAKDFGG